jgi:hypothetical protein
MPPAGAELEVLVDVVAGGVLAADELEVEELELPPPHPATANAITPAASSEDSAKRKFLIRVLMSILSCLWC